MRKLRKLKLRKTIIEHFIPLKRVIMHNGEGKATIYFLYPKRHLTEKKKKMVFTIGDNDYVYDPEKVFLMHRTPYIEYIEGCSLPFSVRHNDGKPYPEYADAKKLYSVLDMHVLDSILAAPAEKLYMIMIIGALVGGFIMGHYFG